MARAYGVDSIEFAPIGADGALPTNGWEKVTHIVNGSVTLTVPELTTNDITVEDIDGVVDVLPGVQEPATISVSTIEMNTGKAARLLGGEYTAVGSIETKGAITGGSLYTSGTYKNVPLTGGTGTGAVGTVVVAGGAVTGVTITSKGSGYTALDELSAAAADIGGTGSGFKVVVATIGAEDGYEAPAVGEIKHLAIRLTSRPHKGKQFQFYFRDAAIVSAISAQFTRDQMLSVGFTAKATVPTNNLGEPVSPWGYKIVTAE